MFLGAIKSTSWFNQQAYAGAGSEYFRHQPEKFANSAWYGVVRFLNGQEFEYAGMGVWAKLQIGWMPTTSSTTQPSNPPDSQIDHSKLFNMTPVSVRSPELRQRSSDSALGSVSV